MYNVNVNNIGIDRVDDQLCIFGKLEYNDDDEYSLIKISFDSFPCTLLLETLNLLERVPFKRNDLIELPGLYIRYEGFDKEEFNKILKQLFAIAISSIPKEFIKINISIKEEWEEA